MPHYRLANIYLKQFDHNRMFLRYWLRGDRCAIYHLGGWHTYIVCKYTKIIGVQHIIKLLNYSEEYFFAQGKAFTPHFLAQSATWGKQIGLNTRVVLRLRM